MQDNLSFRITIQTRTALEKFSKMEGISLGEAARTIIDEAMKSRGIEC